MFSITECMRRDQSGSAMLSNFSPTDDGRMFHADPMRIFILARNSMNTAFVFKVPIQAFITAAPDKYLLLDSN